MIRINLLDWRARRRELRTRAFLAMLASAVVVAVAILAMAMVLMRQVMEQQTARNDYLRQQLLDVDHKIEEMQELQKVKSSLLTRMEVIEQLQASRSATVHFFDEIVNTVPDGVTLRSVAQSDASVTIEGVAESNGRVSTYMKNLDASPWFDNPRLIIIKTSESDSQRRSDFTLQSTYRFSPARPLGADSKAEARP